MKFVIPSDTVPDSMVGRKEPLKLELIMQPGIEVWVWEFPRRMSPVTVHFRSTSTSKGVPDTDSEHSSVVFNVADLRFALTCQSWSANGAEGKQPAFSSISVQSDLKIKISANEEETPPGPGGLWDLLSAAKTNTLVKIHGGLTLQSHPDGSRWKKLAMALFPLKWETSPAQAVVGRLKAVRVRAKTTATNLIAFLSVFCRNIKFDILNILVSSLYF